MYYGKFRNGMLGATVAEEELFRQGLLKLKDKVERFDMFTTVESERKAFQVGMDLDAAAKNLFKGTAKAGIITALSGEMDRWIQHRQKTLNDDPNGTNLSIYTIRSRMLNAINACLILLGGVATVPPEQTVPAPAPTNAAVTKDTQSAGLKLDKTTMLVGGALVGLMLFGKQIAKAAGL